MLLTTILASFLYWLECAAIMLLTSRNFSPKYVNKIHINFDGYDLFCLFSFFLAKHWPPHRNSSNLLTYSFTFQMKCTHKHTRFFKNDVWFVSCAHSTYDSWQISRTLFSFFSITFNLFVRHFKILQSILCSMIPLSFHYNAKHSQFWP